MKFYLLVLNRIICVLLMFSVLLRAIRPVFRLSVTEFAKRRARTFVTRVGLAGRYETFILDGARMEVQTGAIGSAARIGFEEFLDGRWQFSDFTSIILEQMDYFIYQ